jgi:hypothetical protein
VKQFDATTLAALGEQQASVRVLLRLDLPEGTFGFAIGMAGNFVYESVTYVGAGRAVAIDEISGSTDFSVVPITAHLSAIPDSELTPDLLGSIFSYQWHQAPATLYNAYFNPETKALIFVERIARRRLDTLEMIETVGGPSELVAQLQPVTLDNPGRGFMVYGDADQRLIDSDDGFFAFAATAGTQTISWGRLPQTSNGQLGG